MSPWSRSYVARKARAWKGARTPQALKRVRQAVRRHAVNQRTRSATRTLVQSAANIALGRREVDGPEAVAAAISALDQAAEKGIIHPNNAARRKSRLMAKVNAAHLLDEQQTSAAGAGAGTARKRTARLNCTRSRRTSSGSGCG